MANFTYDQFKSWLFPALISALGMMIWNDVNEIKADVKALMAQSNIDKTRIDNLEREVYKTGLNYKSPFPPADYPKDLKIRPVAIMNKDEDDDVDTKDI
jgi:hypothetical protein